MIKRSDYRDTLKKMTTDSLEKWIVRKLDILLDDDHIENKARTPLLYKITYAEKLLKKRAINN